MQRSEFNPRNPSDERPCEPLKASPLHPELNASVAPFRDGNASRFPQDFAFHLSNQELAILKSQIATSSWGGKRKPPLAFTEHGAIMAATILNSTRAIEVSVLVVRAFVQMRQTILVHAELGKRLDQLERKIGTHDTAIGQIFDAIRQLTQPPEIQKRRRIGFL